jgi:hypothetical protein
MSLAVWVQFEGRRSILLSLDQDAVVYNVIRQALEETRRNVSPDMVVVTFQGVDVGSDSQLTEFKTTYDNPLLLEIEEDAGMWVYVCMLSELIVLRGSPFTRG